MKKMKVLSIVATKVLLVITGLIFLLGLAGLAESVSLGSVLWAIFSVAIIFLSLKGIICLVKTKNFKTINRLEGPKSLGEPME